MNQIRIYSQQLVAEALSYMRNGKIDSLEVYDKGQFIGKVTYQELIDFLNHKDKTGNIYAHKLNFDIGTAMLVIKRTTSDFYMKSMERRNFSRQLFIGLGSVAVVALILLGLTRILFNLGVMPGERNNMIANAPGKIMLTLANGRKITLSEAKTGLVIDGSKLTYSDGSKINYQNLLGAPSEASLYDGRRGNIPVDNRQMVLNVLGGGMYRILLPDGSKVWLNSGSSLKFPATFEGAPKRLVELNGEAYFEIAKVMHEPQGQGNKKQRMPFVVVTNTQEIEVLGTHFNVCAYQDEKSVKTTLIEGSIRLRSSIQTGNLPGTLDPSSFDPLQIEGGKRIYGAAIVLKPDQEATLTGTHIVVKNVDADEAFAWTDGQYIFRNMPLETVMNKITRWYDMEVIYQDKEVGQILLGGAISRTSKISEVLSMLELTTNVHFKLEGRRITVTK